MAVRLVKEDYSISAPVIVFLHQLVQPEHLQLFCLIPILPALRLANYSRSGFDNKCLVVQIGFVKVLRTM